MVRLMSIKKQLTIIFYSIWISSCSADPIQQPKQSGIKPYQDKHINQVAKALQQKKINIVQLGDSHTAADYLTDAARIRLQQELGNGGPGWAMPTQIDGMRLARFSYSNNGWQALSSRTQHNENYSLGGLIAKPSVGATLTIKTRQQEAEQTVIVSIRQGQGDDDLNIIDANGRQIVLSAKSKDNQWHFSKFNAQFPITIKAGMNFHTAIGGFWVRNNNIHGAVFSALGINGYQLNQWDRWNSQAWQNELNVVEPDLVILAYGTNEAYNNMDIESVKQSLLKTISQIRTASPKSAIMILGAPESLKNTAGSCGKRPAKLTELQNMQRDVATSQHTLYWDWQAAMGGECSMKSWISQGLARSDGVHFTSSGYQRLGLALANSILAMISKY
jgi:lysophospholipase L1-like esterase